MPAVPTLDLDVITSTARYLLILATAGALGAALGLVRPVRRALVPRSPHVVQTQILLAIVACAFVIAVLWLLESSEPPVRARFELTIGGKDTDKLKPEIEHALSRQGVTYVLLGSSPHELHYEVTVPFQEQIRRLTKLIRSLAGRRGTSVEWDIKKQKVVKP